MQPRRVTQQDIAKAAGVHRSSVCLALQNHPNIPEKTRARIRKIAERLGYAPDPMLSALAMYRNRRRPRAFQGTLAWLANNVPPFDWRRIPIFRQNYEGAVERARTHGYGVEIFDLQNPPVSAKRLAGILQSRNITGLLVAPQPRPNSELDFPWEDFSAVSFGFTLARPGLHCVVATQYRATLQTVQRMRALGYRRIGFASSGVQDDRVNHNSLAAYLAEQLLHGEEPLVLPMGPEVAAPRTLRSWIKRSRIEAAVVSLDVRDALAADGFVFPRDLAVACPMMFDREGSLSGVCENSALIGAAAVDFLVAMIQRGERGVPAFPQRILIEGEWVAGSTCPPR